MGISRCQTIETVHLITGRNIYYNLLLLLKCFTLGNDLDQFYVFLHQDLSRKHFRHSSLFAECFTSALLKVQGCDQSHVSHSGLKEKLPLEEHHVRILRKLRQPHVHCQVFNILLGHMFRSFVNSAPSSVSAGHGNQILVQK